jgi:hypothetical protein
MTVYRYIIFLFISLLAIGCQRSKQRINNSVCQGLFPPVDTIHVQDVSLVNLIATPEKYHQRKIRVIGFLHLEFEGNCLYLHRDDFEYGMSKNAIWLNLTTKDKELRRLSNEYVILEGTFESKMTGHMGMNSGSITNISRLELWHNVK